MKWRYLTWMLPLYLLSSGATFGAEPAAPEEVASPPAERGAATRQWLERQRQGKQASAKAQPLSGPVQEKIYERYEKSFTLPIPEHFERERVGSGSGGR